MRVALIRILVFVVLLLVFKYLIKTAEFVLLAFVGTYLLESAVVEITTRR